MSPFQFVGPACCARLKEAGLAQASPSRESSRRTLRFIMVSATIIVMYDRLSDSSEMLWRFHLKIQLTLSCSNRGRIQFQSYRHTPKPHHRSHCWLLFSTSRLDLPAKHQVLRQSICARTLPIGGGVSVSERLQYTTWYKHTVLRSGLSSPPALRGRGTNNKRAIKQAVLCPHLATYWHQL